MPYIIPNATDTISGAKYAHIDQSEPDALDFEVLGCMASGVVSGCAVTAQSSPNLTVQVASGTVLVNNVAYTLNANSALTLPAAPTNNRFDLVVARLSGGSVSLVVLSGNDSSSNPVYPTSEARATVSSSGNFNSDTDVLLAALYRSGGSTITTSRIVDKRMSVVTGIALRGTSVPSGGLGAVGDLYLKTSSPTSSGFYVKGGDGNWVELQAVGAPSQPIGSLMMWPSTVEPDSAVWVEANGAAVSRSTYSALFAVYGTSFGAGNGTTTFNLPDYRGQYLAGLPGGRNLTTQYGAATNAVTLSANNMPAHTHALTGVSVATGGGHSHTMTHGHTGTAVSADTSHSHTFSGWTDSTTAGYGVVTSVSSASPSTYGVTTNNILHSHSFSGTTSTSSQAHSHSVSVDSFGGTTGTDSGHTHTLSGSSDSAGSGTSFSIEPSTYHVRFFIRWA